MNPLLQIEKLNVKFTLSDSVILAVRDVSFYIDKGETLGLVGESGCGKSVSASSILRLIAPPGQIESGRILYNGKDILSLRNEDLRKIRGRHIAMIFQEPMTSLNPVLKLDIKSARRSGFI